MRSRVDSCPEKVMMLSCKLPVNPGKIHLAFITFLIVLAGLLPPPSSLANDKENHFSYPAQQHRDLQPLDPVTGDLRSYTIEGEDTLLDIARDFNLGYYQLRRLYPEEDAWIPESGRELIIPHEWILPLVGQADVVINLPEMRLYHYDKRTNRGYTYPVSIGQKSQATSVGTYSISEMVRDPTWTVPPSLEEQYEVQQIPPGPDNPVGEYWIGLAGTHLGIHGTNFPWSVGRAVTQGCIRLYPEDISRLYSRLEDDAQVKIVYKPIKFGSDGRDIYVQVYPDIYNRMSNMLAYAYHRLKEKDLLHRVDMAHLIWALQRQSGLPVNITERSGKSGKSGK